MKIQTYCYNCSIEYINSIDTELYNQVITAVKVLPKRLTQAEINADLFWLLTSNGWKYDTIPTKVGTKPPREINVISELDEIMNRNNRELCRTSTTLDTRWKADFAKNFTMGLVQIEAQFGKEEAMFKDFCGFRICYVERRLALGIEIVLSEPALYFAHRKNAIGGMASFNIAKNTLTSVGLDCPILLIGIKD